MENPETWKTKLTMLSSVVPTQIVVEDTDRRHKKISTGSCDTHIDKICLKITEKIPPTSVSKALRISSNSKSVSILCIFNTHT